MTIPPTGVLAAAASAATACADRVCAFCVHEFLARAITSGSLTLHYPDGTSALFGEPEPRAAAASRPVAHLTLVNPASFHARVATAADIGLAEAFMAADFTVPHADHLVRLFRLLILNRDAHALSSATALLLSAVGGRVSALLHRLHHRNTVAGSQRNIEAHYDLSNELFATFLGDTWTYSCAYFDPAVPRAQRTLDAAQHAKIDRVLRKARVTSACRVLDIGCGWGELAIRAALRFGCHVVGITLSREQLALARKRAAAAGVGDRVRFELVDYRALARRGERFDRVVSVEMIEAVGHEFLPGYFAAIDGVLAGGGVAVIQAITTPEQRYAQYRGGTDFIQKHVFPGGVCPSFEAVVCAVGQHTTLCVEDVDNVGPHYATTLREWRRRFVESARRGDVAAAGFDKTFERKWVYYFCYCEAGFATRTLGVLQVVLSRSGNTATLGGMPEMAGCGGG